MFQLFKRKKKESEFERLGRFLDECEHAEMLFSALVGSVHSDVVHFDIIPLSTNWKESFKAELLDAQECINDWFEPYEMNYFKMMFALERIKRKYRIDFDEDESIIDTNKPVTTLN